MRVSGILGGLLSLAAAGWLVIWLSNREVGETPVQQDPLQTFESLGHPPETNPFTRPLTGPFPKVEVAAATFDFGVIAFQPNKEDYRDNSHDFVVKNVGEAPLKLAKGPTNCQCTMSSLVDQELAPGASTTITLTWEPTMVMEEFVKEATIWTNDPALFDADKDKPGQLLLKISGKVVPSVEMTPASFSIGTINEAEPTLLMATVGSRVRTDLEVTLKSVSTPHLEVELVPVNAVQLDERGLKCGYDIQAKLYPRLSIGRFRESIVLATNDSQHPEMTLTVEGRRDGPITVAGRFWDANYGAIDYGTFSAATGAQTILSIYSEGTEPPLTLEVIDTSPPELEVSVERDNEFPETGREHHRMTVRIPPNAPPSRLKGADAGTVRVRTNREDLPELKFRVIYESR